MVDSPNYMTPEMLSVELCLDDLRDKMNDIREINTHGCSAKNGDGIWEGIGLLQQSMDNDNKQTGNMSLRE